MKGVDFHVVIPARFQSSRFPGKLLMDLNGMTVIERVYRQALLANPKSITIATDHADIYEHMARLGATVVMTNPNHQSGTDRVAEVVADARFSEEALIVNVQGDEPFISPLLIEQVAITLAADDAPMATLCWPIERYEEMLDLNVVKVVRDVHQHALYFSRSLIPLNRDNPKSPQQVYRHIGLYAYRKAFLLDFVSWSVCELEETEKLEQLRVLWSGYKIKVDTARVEPQQDINTPEDLVSACRSGKA
jgi:3-deoxy-manno-octulosonate cytidylyltransferase (CMP-KDO synthetase)